jgi:hypothetical protein
MGFIVLVWLACAALGYVVGNSKGRATEGLLLGLILGLIGVVIIACLKPRNAPGQALGHAGWAPPGAAPVRQDWKPDPFGRHDYRWWDGTSWTGQVSDGGVQSMDQPGAMLPPPPASAPRW